MKVRFDANFRSGLHFTLYLTIPTFYALKKKPFETIVGKGENAGNQQFLLFPQCFLPFPKQILTFQSHLVCRFNLDQFKILSFGKELTP